MKRSSTKTIKILRNFVKPRNHQVIVKYCILCHGPCLADHSITDLLSSWVYWRFPWRVVPGRQLQDPSPCSNTPDLQHIPLLPGDVWYIMCPFWSNLGADRTRARTRTLLLNTGSGPGLWSKQLLMIIWRIIPWLRNHKFLWDSEEWFGHHGNFGRHGNDFGRHGNTCSSSIPTTASSIHSTVKSIPMTLKTTLSSKTYAKQIFVQSAHTKKTGFGAK